MTTEWQKVDALAHALEQTFTNRTARTARPDVFMVLGSGLGGVADRLGDKISTPVSTLPHYPQSTVSGHAGMLHMGNIGGMTILVQQGRVHLYEGYTPAEVVRPLRAAVTLGAKTVILTNAAGGIDQTMRPGSLLLIEDHLNLTATSPLLGPNDDERGPRFPDMSEAYSKKLREQLRKSANAHGIPLPSGVYAGLLGPTYETPAEVQMLKTLGAAAVGMSTVQEVIAARHLGAEVAAVSCITNLAAGLSPTPLSHNEVGAAGASASADLAKLLIDFLEANR